MVTSGPRKTLGGRFSLVQRAGLEFSGRSAPRLKCDERTEPRVHAPQSSCTPEFMLPSVPATVNRLQANPSQGDLAADDRHPLECTVPAVERSLPHWEGQPRFVPAKRLRRTAFAKRDGTNRNPFPRRSIHSIGPLAAAFRSASSCATSVQKHESRGKSLGLH